MGICMILTKAFLLTDPRREHDEALASVNLEAWVFFCFLQLFGILPKGFT